MKHLEHISAQIRGIRRGLIDLFDKLPFEIELDELTTAFDVTAICVNAFGEYILHPSQQTTAQLTENVEQAFSAQVACLLNLPKRSSLALTGEIGAILTDLHRILKEVTPSKG